MWRCVRRRGSGGFSAKNIQEFTQKHLNACAGVCYAYHEERRRAPARCAGALAVPENPGTGTAGPADLTRALTVTCQGAEPEPERQRNRRNRVRERYSRRSSVSYVVNKTLRLPGFFRNSGRRRQWFLPPGRRSPGPSVRA